MQNRYPLWKNLLLILLLVFGVIYALPNIFGEDPAIQISATGNAKINTQTLNKVETLLGTQKLRFMRAVQANNSLMIRFYDTDTQIKARDLIKASLDDNYIVALNLASRTPQWLEALGAHPMKLGLDLRGGVHFLLAVDTDAMIKAREAGDVRTIANDLREANIRYRGIERLQPHGLIVRFRDKNNLDAAYSYLKSHLSDYLITKSTNTYELRVLMSEKAILSVVNYAIDQTMNILRNRVNALGVSEAIVQRQGTNHVSVDLPGIQDTARAKNIIGKTATLKFQMVDTEHDAESAKATGDVPLGTKLYSYENRYLLLKDQIILQGDSITYAAASFSQQDGRPSVDVHLGGGGESRFHRVTSENIGKPMAVVYVETKPEQKIVAGKTITINRQIEKIISVATIQSALGNNFEITGLQSIDYAQNLALLLRSGALVAPVNIIEELTVGPSMGKTNIHKGLISIVAGTIFIILFMIFYYRFFGLVANIALILNLIFIVAILSILSATLTLPGIAGMVLTVGMAIDANVLIYERIREELRQGLGVQTSIYAGYERAFTTIVDANVTTLIVAIVLFALGTGAIKGFAVVLTIGLMTSMVTAIMYTRAIVNLMYGNRNIKKLPIGIKIKKDNK